MKRLNVKLALWLVGITVFSVVGGYFLHGFQEDRNAEFLKVQAEQARNEGNDQDAIKHYSQYVRHRDDVEGYKALAELTVKVAKSPKATRNDHIRAYNLLEEAIRRYPDLDEARSSLIDYTMLMRRYGEALDHIAYLQANGSKDTNLELKKAICQLNNGEEDAARKKLFEIVGYDSENQQFAAEPPATAKETEAYLILARLFRAERKNDTADALMQKLVEWNPDLAQAHITRAAYLLSVWETVRSDTPEGQDLKAQLLVDAKNELKRASEIEPDDVDTLLMTSGIAVHERDFPRAQELLDRAMKLNPERADVYLRRSALAFAQGDQEKATAELQTGLDKTENVKPLLEQLVEIQFTQRDLKGAKATCEKMKKVATIPPEYVGYQEARLQMGEGKVIEAARAFEKVRPAMERLGGQYLNTVNSLLGRCYEVLGMPDRQLEVYRRVLSAYPNLLQARIGETAALQALGRHAEAETSVKLLASSALRDPEQTSRILQLVVNQQLSKPQDERDWQQVEKLTAMLQDGGKQTPLQTQLLKSQLLLAQGKSGEALKILGTLRKEHPKEAGVWIALCNLMASEEEYRDRLPQVIALAENALGDVAPLQAERIKIVAREGGDDASQKLQKLEDGNKTYEPKEQQALVALLGTAYLQVGDYENAKRCLKEVMAQEGSNLRVRQLLFDLAMERKDDATVEGIIKELGKSPYFGQGSALYRYCKAAYELQKFTIGRQGKTGGLSKAEHQQLSEVRKSVDEAIALRGEWAPLWRLRGQVDQLDGNVTGAIANYQRSLDYSRSGQTGTARRLVTLLYAAQRYTEANEAMRYLDGSELPDAMRKLVEATKQRVGDTKAALEMARADLQKDPDNPGNYVWYGQLLEGDGDFEGAEQAYLQAVAKGPKLASAWENLVRRLMSNNKKQEAVAAAKKAAESLGDSPLELGRLYQRAGESADAEKRYKQALANEPDNLMIMRHLAELYLSEENIKAALAQLDKIIEKATVAKDPQSAAHAAWARTQKAQNFAPSRDYGNTMEAVKLVEQNAQDGKLATNDMLTIVSLLAPRMDEPPSRARAIELLEKVRLTDKLNAAQMVALGRLYERDGNWDQARNTMSAAMSMGDDNPEACLIFAEMLFDHEDFEESQRYVDRAQDLLQNTLAQPSSPLSQSARVLRARLLVRDGKSEEAVKVLEGWLPRPLPQNGLVWLLQVAQQAESLELNDAASRLFEEYASLDPTTGKLALAAYRGRRGDIEQSFALLEDSHETSPMIEILPIALANVRAFPEKITPGQFKMLDAWAKTALKQSKDPARLKLLIAEMYDLQGRYDDVIKVYRKMLADPEISRIYKAYVQNNLAFILAAVNPTQQSGAEAEKLIEQAIAVLGPTSDLLDTRALSFLAQGKVDEAAADLRTAVDDRPTTSKYYHLAQVEKRLGNADAAKIAIAKAEELHGGRNSFTPAERKGYEQLKSEMN